MSKLSNNNPEDIWTILENNPSLIRKPKPINESIEINSNTNNEITNDEDDQSVIVFLGDSNSGKSTLIQNYLKPNSNLKDPKPTVALEYNFARKKTGSKGGKYIANIWEIGGDSINEPKLLEIPITITSINYSSIVLVIDLTHPNQLLVNTLTWLDITKQLINQRLKQINNNTINIPIYILANKYDIYKNTISLTDKRLILQVLRFISLSYNATLIATSNDVSMKENVRNVLNQIIFRGANRQSYDISLDKPFYVSSGLDSYENILLGVGDDIGKSKLAQSPEDVSLYITTNGLKKDCWNRLAEHIKSVFGPPIQTTDNPNRDEASELINDHPEAEIDAMRTQRDLALERYKQEVERRNKINNSTSVSDNVTSKYNDIDDRGSSNRKSKK